jgi:hypothetical protein
MLYQEKFWKPCTRGKITQKAKTAQSGNPVHSLHKWVLEIGRKLCVASGLSQTGSICEF